MEDNISPLSIALSKDKTIAVHECNSSNSNRVNF